MVYEDMKDTGKIRVFNLDYDNVALDQAVDRLELFISRGQPHKVFTTSAELIVRAQKEPNIKSAYESADLLTIDSRVVYLAARLLGRPFVASVSAVGLMIRFIERTFNKGYRLYFLGARQDVLEKAVFNLRKSYPGINIVGAHHGYFKDDEDIVLGQIIKARPDVVFVGMSSPLKEDFITRNYQKLGVAVLVGVGGGIDILGGYCKLAPKWVTMCAMEWFYRLIQEPKRLWKRYLVTNIAFLWLVFKELFKKKQPI